MTFSLKFGTIIMKRWDVFMKVIFIKNLKGQGKVNEIKEVSDGYAMNYLISNGYAVKYTEGSATRLNREISEKAKLDEVERQRALKVQDKLMRLNVCFKADCGKEGKMFGSISVKQVHEELKRLGFDIDKKKILIDNPINTLGYHTVKIVLHKKVVCELKVNVIRK